MAKKGERKSKLLGEAIAASIEFEKLMDKTDFDSWLEDDNHDKLRELGQQISPYKKFGKNKEKIENICCKMKKKGSNELPKSGDKSSLEKYIVYKLFESKNNRLEARKCSNKVNEKKKYKEALPYLLSALNEHDKFCLQMKQNESNKSLNPGEDNALNKWLIFLYNDLSICYAGLENSSMSRGYAEEAKNIIEEEETYKEFEKIFEEFEKKSDSDTLVSIRNCDFVSSKLYDLYIVELFNQAQAERRSFSYSDAEKNFRKIIKYAEGKTKDNKITPLYNFNYYSALLNLGDLYMDLSRGKEAVELLDKAINNLDENDIRYWNACLARINALIDQSEYGNAEKLLEEFFEKDKNTNLVKRHRITSVGFKAVICYARCKIEKVKNTLGDINKSELKKAQKILLYNLKKIKKRKQEGLELKTYKHLSEVHTLLKEDKKAMEYFIKYFSNGKTYNLSKFVRSKKMEEWINDCDDLDFLESFTEEICKFLKCDGRRLRKGPLRDLFFNEIIEKIKKECGDKNQLSRAERIARKIREVLGEKGDIKYKEGIFDDESSRDKDKDSLTKKDICKRLDINEKEFDSVLFKRSKLKKDDHIAEVIVLRRWNSFSPGLFRESTGSLGGGYLLRIKKNSYLFSFSDIAKKKGRQELLNRLRTLGRSDLAKIMEGAKYREDGGNIRINKNNKKIATLKIEEGLCYLEWNNLKFKIGRVKKEGDKLNIYSEDSDVENIAIDPGYNFLQNLRREGFYINDIDTIIITHSHLDHCAELLPIMDLIYQFNKRYESTTNEKQPKKKVNLCLSLGAYKKFSGFTNESWQQQLKDVIILENLDSNKYEPFKGLTISAIPTPHMDLGGVNAVGLKIKIGENKLCLGFTGDTPWSQKIREKFKECDLLCVHLGSIKYQEIGYTDDRYNLKGGLREIPSKEEQIEFNKTYTEANHLLFFGTLDFITHCNKKDEHLIIVGEFGEELKYGLRRDLCKKLSEKTKIDCLPGDIGLYVGINKDGTKKVRCNFCEEFVGQKEIMTFLYGREDAIHYICKTCDNTLSELQKQAFIEHRLTRH